MLIKCLFEYKWTNAALYLAKCKLNLSMLVMIPHENINLQCK